MEFLSGSDEIADGAAQTEQFDDVSRALPNPISNLKKGGKIDIDEELLPKFSPLKRRQAIVDSNDEGIEINTWVESVNPSKERTLDNMYADLDVSKSKWYELFKYFDECDYTKN